MDGQDGSVPSRISFINPDFPDLNQHPDASSLEFGEAMVPGWCCKIRQVNIMLTVLWSLQESSWMEALNGKCP